MWEIYEVKVTNVFKEMLGIKDMLIERAPRTKGNYIYENKKHNNNHTKFSEL